MSQIDPTSIVLGIILTYGIGLAPALLLRFVLFKKPLSRIISVLICFVWFVLWTAFIISLRVGSGQEPRLSGGSFIMIFCSYYILSKGYYPKSKHPNIITRRKSDNEISGDTILNSRPK